MTQITYKLDRACSTCSTRIYDSSSTGLCKRCFLRQRNRSAEGRRASSRIGLGNWRRNLLTPETQAKRIASIRAGAARYLQWLPRQYRAEYRRLVKSGIGFQAARAEIERHIRTNLSFEEKLQLVSEGKLNIYTMPDLRSPDPSGTLGGVASGWVG
jgi:hypothetical protein